MKLALIGPTYPLRGGIARYGSCLLGCLQRRHECLAIGFRRLYPKALFPGSGEMECGSLPPGGAAAEPLLHYADPLAWRQAALRVKAFAPDGIVLTWWVTFWAAHFGYLARKVGRRAPVVFLCHNVLPHETRWFDSALTRWALKPASGFIVHADEDRRRLTEWFPGAAAIRRNHPIYPPDAQALPNRAAARQMLGVQGQMLLFFGFVRPYKGLDVALEALALLRNDLQDLRLWIAGEFWDDVSRYRVQIERLGLSNRVHLENGYLPESALNQRLQACDGVLLPYRSATGSGALATAFGAGRPVVATRTGGFMDSVEEGESGVLCEPGDAHSLADAFRRFYAGEGPNRFQAGIARAQAKFTWDAVVDGIEELIRG